MKKKATSAERLQCTGCGLCTLNCPVWRTSKDVYYCFSGRETAIKRGANPEELRDSINSCVLCGACEPGCPVGIKTTDATLELRSLLKNNGVSIMDEASVPDPKRFEHDKDKIIKNIFIPSPALYENERLLDRTLKLLGKVDLPHDDGRDIAARLEAGLPIDEARRKEFLKTFVGIKELILDGSVLFRPLRRMLPFTSVTGLGEAILCLPGVKDAINESDLYVIEPRAFNSDCARLAAIYDRIRQERGCMMNLDLQRIAIATGSSSIHPAGMRRVDPAAQAKWILQGLKPKRIVVESVYDMGPFKEAAPEIDVIHSCELVPEVEGI